MRRRKEHERREFGKELMETKSLSVARVSHRELLHREERMITKMQAALSRACRWMRRRTKFMV